MGYTPEGKIKARVRRILEINHAYHFMPATGGYGRAGVFMRRTVCAGVACPATILIRQAMYGMNPRPRGAIRLRLRNKSKSRRGPLLFLKGLAGHPTAIEGGR